MSEVSDNELEKLQELRDILGEYLRAVPDYDTDFNLLRWLKGFDYNKEVIVRLLREHLRLRKAWRLDKILDEPQNEICKVYYPYGLFPHTISKDCNSVLFIEPIGLIDHDGLFKSVSIFQILRDRVRGAELATRQILKIEAETGKRSGLFFIFDLDGLTFDLVTCLSLVTGPYKSLCQFFGTNYAEQASKFVVINAPTFFTYIFAAMMPFLGEKTQEKVMVLGTDWKEVLRKYVDADRLPVHWGGAMVDETGDEKCRSIVVVPPGKIPESLYWKPNPDDPKLDDLTELYVYAGAVEFLTFEVTVAGASLSWYYTCNSNFSFGIFCTADEGETDLEKMEMVFPHIINIPGPLQVCEKGQIICPNIGFYKVKFGNENAWLYGLTVKHKFQLLHN